MRADGTCELMYSVDSGDEVVLNQNIPSMSHSSTVRIMSMTEDRGYNPHDMYTRSVTTGDFDRNKLYTVSRVTSERGELSIKIYGFNGTYPIKYFRIASKYGNTSRTGDREAELRELRDADRRIAIRIHGDSLSSMMARQEEAIIRASGLPREAVIDGKKIKLDSEDDQSDVLVIKQLVKLDL